MSAHDITPHDITPHDILRDLLDEMMPGASSTLLADLAIERLHEAGFSIVNRKRFLDAMHRQALDRARAKRDG